VVIVDHTVVTGSKSDLDDQLAPFSALTRWLGHLACRIVTERTYKVSSGTLSLYSAESD